MAGKAGLPLSGANALVATVSAVDWTAAGALTVSSGEKINVVGSTVAFGGTPDAPAQSTAIVRLLDSHSVTVKSGSVGQTHVVLTAQGWFDAPPPPVGIDVLAPNVRVIKNAPAGTSATLTFTPPISEPYALTSIDSKKVSISVGGQDAATFDLMALDTFTEAVPATVAVNGASMIVTVTPNASTSYPITVGMMPQADIDGPLLARALENVERTSVDQSGVQPPPGAGGLSTGDLPEPLDPNLPWYEKDLVTSGQEIKIGRTGHRFFVHGSTIRYDDARDPDGLQTTYSASGYVPIPARYDQGIRVAEKYYIYDPEGENPVRPMWKRSQHDYCTWPATTVTTDKDSWAPHVSMVSSFAGACARHDLCIEFKQAPHRQFCDVKFLADMRRSCSFAVDSVDYLSHLKEGLLSRCNGRADRYYWGVVHLGTNKNDEPGKWGHDGPSSYPTYDWWYW